MGGGTNYRCRIAGGEDVAGVEVENEFGSRYSDFTASPHIECVTPPRDGAASDVEAAGLSISLNSADWTEPASTSSTTRRWSPPPSRQAASLRASS